MPERPRPIVGSDLRAITRRRAGHCRHLGACRYVGILAVAPAGSAPRGLAWERKRQRFSRARRRHDGCTTEQREEVPSGDRARCGRNLRVGRAPVVAQ